MDCKEVGRENSSILFLLLTQSHSSSSSSSSIDSSNNRRPDPDPALMAALPMCSSSCSSSSSSSSSSSRHVSRNCRRNSKPDDLITDLSLDLRVRSHPPKMRGQDQCLDWPPIKSILRNSLEERVNNRLQRPSLFVKVYMEGIPIGRKLNLLAHDSYEGLVKALSQMFRIIIQCPDNNIKQKIHYSDEDYMLTYQDEEGDWMLVGDVPWELFVAGVKRLKITRAERC